MESREKLIKNAGLLKVCGASITINELPYESISSKLKAVPFHKKSTAKPTETPETWGTPEDEAKTILQLLCNATDFDYNTDEEASLAVGIIAEHLKNREIQTAKKIMDYCEAGFDRMIEYTANAIAIKSQYMFHGKANAFSEASDFIAREYPSLKQTYHA